MGNKRTPEEFSKIIAERFPDIKLLNDYTNSNTQVQCECLVCGYGKNGEWTPRAYRLLSGKGCPNCLKRQISEKMRMSQDEFINRMYKQHPTIKVIGQYAGSNKPVACHCEICGTDWNPKPINLLYGNHGKGNGCKVCRAISETSFPEQAIYFYIRQVFPDSLNNYCDFSPTGMELDIFIPSIKTGIEYDGIVWHRG